MKIEQYDRAGHRDDVVAAWNREYPYLCTNAEWLDDLTVGEPEIRPEHALVGVVNGRAEGFTLFREDFLGKGERGGIAVLVYPRGDKDFGRALLRAAEERLRGLGCKGVGTGGGGPSYLIPGVPVTHPELLHIFLEKGYQFGGFIFDIFRNVEGYAVPGPVAQSIDAFRADGIEVRCGRPGEQGAYHAFMDKEFGGGWAWMARRASDVGCEMCDTILAVRGKEILGFAMTWHMASPYKRTDHQRSLCLSKPGALGAIGVAAESRTKGLGLAILSVGTDHLAHDRGCEHVVIGCTSQQLSLGFYAKAGYIVYQNYYGLSKGLA